MQREINKFKTVIDTKKWMLEQGLSPIKIAREIHEGRTISGTRTIVSRIINNRADYPSIRRLIERTYSINLPAFVPASPLKRKRSANTSVMRRAA